MRPKVSLWYLLIVLSMGFLFLFVTEITLVLGMLILPFSLYYLVRLKHKSSYHFWLTFVSFIIPVFLIMSPLSWISLILLYALAYLVERSLKLNYTQEYTMFYFAATMTIIVIGGLNILQLFNVISPFGEIWASLVSWYFEQVDESGMSAFIDMTLVSANLELFYLNIQGQLTIFSIATAIFVILLLRWLLRHEEGIKLWPAKSFKDWVFPRFVMYLFFIFFILSFFMSPTDNAVFYAVVSNVLLVLEWIIYIHGLAFVYFYAREKNINVALSILILIPFLVLRPITMLIGLFEMAFRIRQWIIMKRK